MSKKNKKTQKTSFNVSGISENATPKLQKKIIFCKGTEYEAIHNQDARTNYENKIEQLKIGGRKNYRELELDYKGEHHGMKIYTIKLNRSDRVVFHYQKEEAKNSCFLIIRELIFNHDYAKSKMLRDLESKLTPEKIAELSLQRPEERLELELVNVEKTTHVLAASEYWFNGKVIVLSEDQKKAEGSYASMPFLIEGPPGSGKSIILLMGVYHRLQQLTVDDADILVVAESEKVIAYLKKLWEENFPAMELARVQFKTYKQLILERMEFRLDEKDEGSYFIGYEKFKAFYKEYRKNAPTKVIAKKQVKIDAVHYVLPADKGKITEAILEELLCRAVYQELRVIAFWKGYNERIGQKDSYFDITTHTMDKKPIDIKEWMTQVYKDYSLKTHDLAFMEIPLEKRKKEFSAVFGDEIQDLSSEQWGLLSCLSGGQLGGYFDSFQSVKADKPIINVLKSVLNTQYPHVTCDDSLILSDTYRCPQAIAAIATPIIHMRNTLAGGTGRKGQLTEFRVAASESNKKGNAHLYILKSEQERNTLVNEIRGHWGCYKPTEILIITYENKTETKGIFGEHCIVLTPEEAKGLEFDWVILWYPMGKPASSVYNTYKNANEKLRDMREKNGSLSSSHQHQAVLENMDNRFSRVFQELFTALTRAKKRVIFCQDEYDYREHGDIMNQLSHAFPNPEILPQSSSALVSTDEEWHVRIYQLLLNGNIEEAKNLIQHHLHREEMDVNKRLNLYLAQYYQNKGAYNTIYAELGRESKAFIQRILGAEKVVGKTVIETTRVTKEELNKERLLCFQISNETGERVIDELLKAEDTRYEACLILLDIFKQFSLAEQSAKWLNEFFDALLLKVVGRKRIVSIFHALTRYALNEAFESEHSYKIAPLAIALLVELYKNTVFIEKLKQQLEKQNGLCEAVVDANMPSLLYCLVSTPIGYKIFSEKLNTLAIMKKITGAAFFKRYDNKNETPYVGTSIFYYWVLRDTTDTLVRNLFEIGKILDGTPMTTTYQARGQEEVYYYAYQFKASPKPNQLSVPISPVYMLFYRLFQQVKNNTSYWFAGLLENLASSDENLRTIIYPLVNDTLPIQEDFNDFSGSSFCYYLMRFLYDQTSINTTLFNEIEKVATIETFSMAINKFDLIEEIDTYEIVKMTINMIFRDITEREKEKKPARRYNELLDKIALLNEVKALYNLNNRMDSFIEDLLDNRDNQGLIKKLDFIVNDVNVAQDLFKMVVSLLSNKEVINADFYERFAKMLMGLCVRKEGMSFLIKLIDANPEFLKIISKELLLFKGDKKYGAKNFLKFLVGFDDNDQYYIFFLKIFSQPNSWQTLESILSDEEVNSPLKRIMLKKLFEKKKLCLNDETILYNSIFYHVIMSHSEQAIALLKTLVKAIDLSLFKEDYNKILSLLTEALFCRTSLDQLLPIFVLLQTSEKRQILFNIAEKVAFVMNNNKNAAYFLAKVKSGEYAGQSVLHHLVKTEEGIKIFLKIFSYKKEDSIVYSPLLPKCLCETASFLNNQSPLECLCGFSNPEICTLLQIMCTEEIKKTLCEVPALFTCVIASSSEKETLGEWVMPKKINNTLMAAIKILNNYSDKVQEDFLLKVRKNLIQRSIFFESETTAFGLVKRMLRGLNAKEYEYIFEEASRLNQEAEENRTLPGVMSDNGVDGVWNECYIKAVSDLLLKAVVKLTPVAVLNSHTNENVSLFSCSSAFYSTSGNAAGNSVRYEPEIWGNPFENSK